MPLGTDGDVEEGCMNLTSSSRSYGEVIADAVLVTQPKSIEAELFNDSEESSNSSSQLAVINKHSTKSAPIQNQESQHELKRPGWWDSWYSVISIELIALGLAASAVIGVVALL